MVGTITNDIDVFIDSIKKRPALYVKTLKDYSNAVYKKKLWDEVCIEVVADWEKLNEATKMKLGAEVRKKWLNLRTCFTRELKLKKTVSKEVAAKRREYIFFDKLLFLRSSVASRSQKTSGQSSDVEEENAPTLRNKNVASVRPTRHFHKRKIQNSKLQNSLLQLLKQDLDEDKHFALSLIPTLKSLTQDEKLQAKIEILQTLQKIKNNRITVNNIAQFTETNANSSNQNQYYYQQPCSSPLSSPTSIKTSFT